MMDCLEELARLAMEFSKGRPGVHFLVESGEEGFGYRATPIERRLIELGRLIREELAADPQCLTHDAAVLLIRAMAAMGPGTGQIRARFIAGGGDYDIQDSAAREFVVEGIERIRTALELLGERGVYPLDGLSEEELLTPIEIGAFRGRDAKPFIERCFDARMALFRRPRIAPLVRRLIDEADREAAREASRIRKLAKYRRTVIDDGRDGLLPEPPASGPGRGNSTPRSGNTA